MGHNTDLYSTKKSHSHGSKTDQFNKREKKMDPPRL